MVRRIWWRVLVVCGLVAVTAVQPAQQAQALDGGQFGRSTLTAAGGVRALAPGIAARVGAGAAGTGAAAVCATGVGCAAIAAGALVIGAGITCYEIDACKDTVIPWVQNKLGAGGLSDESYPCAPVAGYPCYGIGPIGFVSTPNATDPFYVKPLQQPIDGWDAYVNFTYKCKNGSSDGGQFVMSGDTVNNPIRIHVCYNSGGLASVKVTPTPRNTGRDYFVQWNNEIGWEGGGGTVTSATVSIKCRNPETGATYSRETITVDPKEALRIGHCEPGDVLEGVDLGASIDGGPNQPQQTLDLRPTPKDNFDYAKCANSVCEYRIMVDGKPCVAGVEECTHWTYLERVSPDRVECFYGPYRLPDAIGSCPSLERVYELDGAARTTTRANTDGDFDTEDAPKRTPISTPSPSPTGTATPTPTPTPSNPTVTDEQLCMSGDPRCPVPVTPENPTGSRSDQCWPSGWGALNPASWVLQPVKCAWRWATVPRTSVVQTTSTRIRTDIETSGPAPLVTPIKTAVDSISPDGSGCRGPALRFDYASMHVESYPLDACSGWKATAAFLVKAFVSMTLVFGGGAYLVNSLAVALGYNKPIVRGGGGS